MQKANKDPVGQAHMLILMNEYRAEKLEGMTVEVVDRFPPLESLEAMTFLGSFAWTSQATKQKWIKKQFALNIGVPYVTPSDIARDYLAVKFGSKPLRCDKRVWAEVVNKKKHQPLYAQPCTLDHANYIDLKSAYWQLLMLGGWDVEYSPKRFLSPRSDVYDFPVPEIKLARNCLVSMGLPSGVNVWTPRVGFEQKKPYKPTVNLVLWRFVQDVLHGIASDMVEKAGAVYVNTDGYIVPDSKMAEVEMVAQSWGLFFTIKESGQAVIRGAGDYDIGGHRSRRLRTIPKSFSYIHPTEIDWLRKKINYWSYRIDLDMKQSDVRIFV